MSFSGGQNLGTATFYIVGDASGAEGAAARTNAALASMSGSVQQNLFAFNQLGLAFAALPVALGAAVSAAVGSFIEIEDAIYKLDVALGEDADVTKQVSDQIISLGRSVPIATKELLGLAAAGAQLGIATEGLDEFAATMGIFVTATDAGEAEVANLAKILNVFGLETGAIEGLTSTVIELGRNAAATTPEIVNITKRISGAANAAGFTAQQALALGTALISLGPNAEAGATALNKTINDMVRAVSTGGDALQNFANVVTNGDMDQFVTLFRDDAPGAVIAFAQSLSSLNVEQQVQALDALGITESRQVTALQQLAAGNELLANTMRATVDEYQFSEAAAEAVAAKQKTLGGQIQVLKNIFTEFGVGLAGIGAGPLGYFIDKIGDMLIGFLNLPGPIKLVSLIIIGLMAGLSALAAVALIVGPRILIMRQGLNDLRNTSTGVIAGMNGVALSINGVGAAAARNILPLQGFIGTAQKASLNNSLQKAFGGIAGVGSNVSAFTQQAQKATGTARILASVGAKAGTAVRGLGIAGTVASVGLGLLSFWAQRSGDKIREQAEAALEAQQANLELAKIMYETGDAMSTASLEFLRSTDAYVAAQAAARALGLDMQVLDAIITGTAKEPDFAALETALQNASAEVYAMYADIDNLTKSFTATRQRSGVAAGGIKEVSDAESELAENAKKANDELQKQHDLLEQIAQANIDIIDAIEGQSDAQRSLADAQRELTEAREDAQDHAREVAAAENDLAQARISQERAVNDVTDAELELSEAREKSARELVEAQESLEDAQQRIIDSNQNIKDLQEDLNELRSEDYIDEIREATNKLANAQNKLAAAHVKVSDLEFALQQRREDGASLRDIQDAERALAEARQDVTNVNSDIIDSQKELDQLRAGGDLQERVAAKERDLQKAYRDSEKAARELQDRERLVAEARRNVVNDTAYKDAALTLRDAQLSLEDATLGVVDAERGLIDTQANVEGQLRLRDAEEAVSDAAFALAQANVDVTKQQALMAGGTFDAADAAHALANELSALLGIVPDAETQGLWDNYIRVLATTREIPPVPVLADGSAAPNPGAYFPSGPDLELEGELQAQRIAEILKNTAKTTANQAETILRPVRDAIYRGINLLPIPESWKQSARTGVTSVLNRFVGLFTDETPNLVTRLKDDIEGKNIGRKLVDWMKIPEGSEGAKAAFQGFGGKGAQGLEEGLVARFDGFTRNTIGKIPGDIKNIIEPGALALLQDSGRRMASGIATGGENGFGSSTSPFFSGLPARIASFFGGADQTLKGSGQGLIRGLGNGVETQTTYLGTTVMPFIPGRLAKAMGNVGLNFEELGKDMMRGIQKGLTQEEAYTVAVAKQKAVNLAFAMREAVKSKSPSKLTRDLVGIPIMQGVAVGMEQAAPAAMRVAGNVALDAVQALSAELDGNPEIGKNYVESIIDGMEGQFAGIKNVMEMLKQFLSEEFVNGLMEDVNQNIQSNFASSRTGLSSINGSPTAPGGGGIVNNYNDVSNLQAITNADPTKIFNAYNWDKRVRLRGGNP